MCDVCVYMCVCEFVSVSVCMCAYMCLCECDTCIEFYSNQYLYHTLTELYHTYTYMYVDIRNFVTI